MKRHISTLTMAVALLLSAGSAHAQSTVAAFKVPFDFVAGTTLMSAGEYHVSNGPSSALLVLRGGDAPPIFVLAGSLQTPNDSTKTTLVFHRYGSRYFLAQLRIQGNNRGRELPPGSQEREMARNSASESAVVVARSIPDVK